MELCHHENEIMAITLNKLPQSLELEAEPDRQSSSSDRILNEETGVEPGCVEIIPRKRVTLHVLTWLYSLQTETRYFSDRRTFFFVNKENKKEDNQSANYIIEIKKRFNILWSQGYGGL